MKIHEKLFPFWLEPCARVIGDKQRDRNSREINESLKAPGEVGHPFSRETSKVA